MASLDPLSESQANATTSSSHRLSNTGGIREMASDRGRPNTGTGRILSPATHTPHVDSISFPCSGEVHDSAAYKESTKRRATAEENGKTTYQVELEQDATTDPTPFDFKPYELAHMLEAKDLGTFASFGGAAGLLRGLGTNAEQGLPTLTTGASSHATTLTEKESIIPFIVVAQHAEKDNVPQLIRTDPSGDPGELKTANASLADRKRIYGENILPTRPSKTFLQLACLALKDRVLVCIHRL